MSSFIKYLYNFLFGSMFGCLLETIWCIIKNKKYESRKGLIYGYFIPIYGLATMMLSICANLLNINSYFYIYVLTFILCFIIEYISSIIQEKVFGTKSWDYSKMKLNINGRVNIIYLSIWSFIGVLWYATVPNFLKTFISILYKYHLIYGVTIFSILFMVYNIFISVAATYRQKLRRKNIKAKNKFELFLDRKYSDGRLKKIYANAIII